MTVAKSENARHENGVYDVLLVSPLLTFRFVLVSLLQFKVYLDLFGNKFINKHHLLVIPNL